MPPLPGIKAWSTSAWRTAPSRTPVSPSFPPCPSCAICCWTGNAGIDGGGLSALRDSCKLDLLALDRTGLEDAGLLQAASIPKLSHIRLDHTAVTYEGLLAVAGNNYIQPVAHVQFTKEQMEHFSQLQREKAKKPVQLDEQAAAECRRVLSAFFAEIDGMGAVHGSGRV